jgi:tRNA A37 threonylcarbamoyladenosine biosynthesis protein TsaE
MTEKQTFADLPALAAHLRKDLETKKNILLFAYNGTGKTRLSMAFKDIGKKINDDGETIERDTLYFNAFTEDLFHWDNDLEGDSDRLLKINSSSRFFSGLAEMEMDTRIRPLLRRYADFDFRIDTENWTVSFSRTVNGQICDNIKVSRGEENIFIWCFFLAIVQLALDKAESYRWVKYLYIDDPISSLDEHNAIAVATHLAQLIKQKGNADTGIRTVISTPHPLFFNVLFNELGKARKYGFNKQSTGNGFILHEEKGDTPFFNHVYALVELYQSMQEDRLFTYHFNMLRSILEKTASFHGYKHFSDCIKKQPDDPDGILHARLINILSHGNYSLYEPKQMLEENKEHFNKILTDFLNCYPFNQDLFSQTDLEAGPP